MDGCFFVSPAMYCIGNLPECSLRTLDVYCIPKSETGNKRKGSDEEVKEKPEGGMSG